MPVAVCQALNRGQIGMAKLRLMEGAPMKKKLCSVALAVSAALPVGFVAMSSPAAAQPPGELAGVGDGLVLPAGAAGGEGGPA